LENAVSGELLARLDTYPKMRAVLDALPPKMLSLEKGRSSMRIDFEAGSLGTRVEEVTRRIQGATFTGKGDKPVVIGIYKDYVTRLADMLQKTLTLASVEPATIELPPMPPDATLEVVRAWHLDVLRVQHASIADALSGQRLDTLTECVQIAIRGKDTSGNALVSVRDAAGLAMWLPSLRDATCALLTAGPAAGKTWLMSQVLMHMLNGERTPILIKVEQLQVKLAQHKAKFDAAPDWVDAFLELTCEAPHYAMLRQEMAERRTVLLIDGEAWSVTITTQ
jgi:hypothetical protein